MKLIYHSLDETDKNSPFDEAILEIAKGKNIFIACPYLGLAYLEKITLECNSWILITDFLEWVKAHGEKGRREIVEFIARNPEKIRHMQNLHAKVIFSDEKCLIGSANFTEKGIFKRSEMSILFEDIEKMREIADWYDGLWNKSYEIRYEEAYQYLSNLPKIESVPSAIIPKNFKNNSIKKIIKKPTIVTIVKIENKELDILLEDESNLVKTIVRLNNKDWAEKYGKMVGFIIKELNIENEDSRFHISLHKIGSRVIKFTIGNRVILTGRLINDENYLQLLLGNDFSDLKNFILKHEAKRPYDATWYNINDITNYFTDLESHVLNQAKKELSRIKKDKNKPNHSAAAYKFCTDSSYRKEILDRAFPVVRIDNESLEILPNDESILIKIIKKIKSREHIEKYAFSVGKIIEKLELNNNDARFHISMDFYDTRMIKLTIGNRHILVLRLREKNLCLEMLLGNHVLLEFESVYTYKAKKPEDATWYNTYDFDVYSYDIANCILEQAQKELSRIKKDKNKSNHSVAAYKFCTDSSYRQEILDRALPKES